MKDNYINIIVAILGLISAVIIFLAALVSAGVWKPELTFSTNWFYVIGVLIFIFAFYLFRRGKGNKSQFHPIAIAGPTKKFYFNEMPFVRGVYWNVYTEDNPPVEKFKNRIKVNIDGNPHCPKCKTEYDVVKGLIGYTWKCPMCGNKMRFKDEVWNEKESVKKIIKSEILRSFDKS